MIRVHLALRTHITGNQFWHFGYLCTHFQQIVMVVFFPLSTLSVSFRVVRWSERTLHTMAHSSAKIYYAHKFSASFVSTRSKCEFRNNFDDDGVFLSFHSFDSNGLECQRNSPLKWPLHADTAFVQPHRVCLCVPAFPFLARRRHIGSSIKIAKTFISSQVVVSQRRCCCYPPKKKETKMEEFRVNE